MSSLQSPSNHSSKPRLPKSAHITPAPTTTQHQYHSSINKGVGDADHSSPESVKTPIEFKRECKPCRKSNEPVYYYIRYSSEMLSSLPSKNPTLNRSDRIK